MSKISIQVHAKDRQLYLQQLLEQDGLDQISEDSQAAYCPISLTQTPEQVKPYVLERQRLLIEKVLAPAGITGYDPSTAPYSPDTNLKSLPQEIYLVDTGKLVGARYFVGHNLLPSTGFGVEVEKASRFNRVAVILFDTHIRVSRMQPHRVIYLQYENFEKQVAEFAEVFKLLSQYDPGMGFVGKEAVLLGFQQQTGEVVNLEQLVYHRFPQMTYQYDGTVPTLDLAAVNSELFYEHCEAD